MEERIGKLLKAEEQIRWTGKPENDPFFTAANKGRLIVRWIIMAIVAVGLSVAYAVYCTNKHITYYWVVNIFTIGVPLYAAVLPYMDYKRLRKVVYAITDRRVIVSANPNRTFDMNLADVDRIEISPCCGGSTLLLGSAVANAHENKLRVLALYGKMGEADGKERTVGLALYNLADADIARSLLIEGPVEAAAQ